MECLGFRELPVPTPSPLGSFHDSQYKPVSAGSAGGVLGCWSLVICCGAGHVMSSESVVGCVTRCVWQVTVGAKRQKGHGRK